MKLSRMRIKSGYRGCFPLYSLRKHATTTMDLKKLFTEERAVSPVIGVILMVAITVILAAVIGAFVLGIGGETNSTPQASLSIEIADQGDEGNVSIEHRGGDRLDFGEITAILDGNEVSDTEFDGDLRSGQTQQINVSSSGLDGGERLVLIHDPSDGQITSRTL